MVPGVPPPPQAAAVASSPSAPSGYLIVRPRLQAACPHASRNNVGTWALSRTRIATWLSSVSAPTIIVASASGAHGARAQRNPITGREVSGGKPCDAEMRKETSTPSGLRYEIASPGLMRTNRVERRAVVARNAVRTARRDARTSAQAARRRGEASGLVEVCWFGEASGLGEASALAGLSRLEHAAHAVNPSAIVSARPGPPHLPNPSRDANANAGGSNHVKTGILGASRASTQQHRLSGVHALIASRGGGDHVCARRESRCLLCP